MYYLNITETLNLASRFLNCFSFLCGNAKLFVFHFLIFIKFKENESFLTGYEGAKGVIDFSAEEFFKQDGKNHQLVSISMIAVS